MKAISRLPEISAVRDRRAAVLLILCLAVVIIHLCQFPPYDKAGQQATQKQSYFTWLPDQHQGEGLYRLPASPETAEVGIFKKLPNRLRPLFFQPVSVNRADQQLLANLPGIGPVLAERIVKMRDRQGGFKAPRDLLLVSGLGLGKLNKIRNQLVFD